MSDSSKKIYRSSKSDVWITPDWVKHYVYNEHGCDFDPCPVNPSHDALSVDWGETWGGKKPFVNPPYSKAKRFLQKAVHEIEKDSIDEAVFLLYTNTETQWWQTFVQQYAHVVEFIEGTLKFTNPSMEDSQSAMRPSTLIHFDPEARLWTEKELLSKPLTKQQQRRLKNKTQEL